MRKFKRKLVKSYLCETWYIETKIFFEYFGGRKLLLDLEFNIL